MVKTISMDIEEYQQEVNAHFQTGICQTLDQFTQFIKSKKTPSEFFGKECLDLSEKKSHLILQLLTELGYGDKVVELIKKTTAKENAEAVNSAHEVNNQPDQPVPKTEV